jgi:ubiquinone/menaquinone biosynthesis C-methylase UbiE
MISIGIKSALKNMLIKVHLWKPVEFFIMCLSVILYKIAGIKLFEIDQQLYWSARSTAQEPPFQKEDPYYKYYDSCILDEIRDLKEIETILEVGCYTGKMLSLIQKEFYQREITGCDIGSEQLLLCRNKTNLADVGLVQCDAAFLPFKNNTFDLVLTSTCLQHIPDSSITQTIGELNRVGKRHLLLAECYIRHLPAGKKFQLLSSNYYYMHEYEKLLRKTSFNKVKNYGMPDENNVNRYSIFVYKKNIEV